MKKELFTVAVDNYYPELCRITHPFLESYAHKIGAEFTVITERKFPDFPPTYEKVQVYELGRDNDYNILVDSDVLLMPNLYNVLEMYPPEMVGSYMQYDARVWYKNLTEPFLSDNRYIGIASNMVVTSKQTHELWRPLDMPAEKALSLVHRSFIIDEFCLSYNLAKHGYGLVGVIHPAIDNRSFVHLNITTDNHPVDQLLYDRIKSFMGI